MRGQVSQRYDQLTGLMLAILKAKKEKMGARWIVFDGIDVLLTLLQDPIAEMREIYRVRDWLADNELTAIITAKVDGHKPEVAHYDFMRPSSLAKSSSQGPG